MPTKFTSTCFLFENFPEKFQIKSFKKADKTDCFNQHLLLSLFQFQLRIVKNFCSARGEAGVVHVKELQRWHSNVLVCICLKITQNRSNYRNEINKKCIVTEYLHLCRCK